MSVSTIPPDPGENKFLVTGRHADSGADEQTLLTQEKVAEYDRLWSEQTKLQEVRANCKVDFEQFALDPRTYREETIAQTRERYKSATQQQTGITRQLKALESDPLVRSSLERREHARARVDPGNGTWGGFAGFAGAPPQGGGDFAAAAWLEPGDLPAGLLPVPALVEALIPEPLRLYLADITARMQCPLEFPTIAAIVALASVVGRTVGLRPKQYDDWLVIANLWGGVIGRPGIMKTPALAEPMRALKRLEAHARATYEEALRHYDLSKLVAKAKRDDLERQLKDAIKKGHDPELILASSSLIGEEAPIARRYTVNDSTVEKLGELLNQNPRGLLLFRDELTGWLRTLDREGHENDRAFYLEAWNGQGSYTYDRIGRGTLHIQAACVSILGGIQPGPLSAYLRAALRGEAGDDGLIQRFQLLVYPDDVRSWRNVDRWPDTAAKHRVWTLFEKLDTLDPFTIGAVVTEGDEIPYLHFTSEGQALFDGWRSDLEQKIRSSEEHPALEAHLAKYRSLMPSLALLFHLLEVVDGTAEGAVSQRSAALAAAWCDFLEAHARRIYQGVTQHALFSARQLAVHLTGGQLKSPFTTRQVYNNGWSGLTTAEECERAVEILEDLHWLRTEKCAPGPQGGRPSVRYHLNPRLQGKGAAG